MILYSAPKGQRASSQEKLWPGHGPALQVSFSHLGRVPMGAELPYTREWGEVQRELSLQAICRLLSLCGCFSSS